MVQSIASHNLKTIGTDVSDTLFATVGNDKQFDRAGNDTLNGGEGHDELVGGAGNDVFVFDKGYSKDVIVDFPGESSIRRSDHDTVIDFGDGDTLTLLGVKPGQIDESDFLVS